MYHYNSIQNPKKPGTIAIIFDLDMTLVDTYNLFFLREKRRWNEVYKNIPNTKLFPGVRNMLKYLQKEKIIYGIVTSSPRKYAEKVINYHNLPIKITVAYHDTKKHKPNPEPICLAIDRLGLTSCCKIIVLGDEEKDILSGYAAGDGWMYPIGVSWGIDDTKQLNKVRAKKIITSFKELKLFIQKLNKKKH